MCATTPVCSWLSNRIVGKNLHAAASSASTCPSVSVSYLATSAVVTAAKAASTFSNGGNAIPPNEEISARKPRVPASQPSGICDSCV
ncbi:unannotated protein [freshwater metagenome]|uniref:Unannotated protein n=1 Tax=freshwater metagenome TaxID=449393 RepID=A0A6J6MBA0_9ZZZZ